MENGIDKKALFNLKSEPYLKPISDIGVGFYNLDENTAILRFQLYNDKGPLLLHENNLTAYAYFESSNGSVSDVIELDIEDSYNGVVSITLDKEFLQASTSTTVKGQVYIGVNNVDGNPKYNEVAVFREFKFEVADALINKISSFTKIEQIRMFSQLKMKIEQEVKDIEEAIANGADYVAEMKSVLQKGVETLNEIVNDGKKDIQSYISQAKTDLTKVKNDATGDITTTANNAKSSVQDTASTAVNSINSKTAEATEHVDSKVTEFNQTVVDNGFLSPQILDEELENLDWQKSKLTNDDGRLQQLSEFDFDNPELIFGEKSQFAYVSGALNHPNNSTSNGTVMYLVVTTDYKRIEYRPNGSNKIFYRRKEAGVWLDWKEITNNQSDTGWIPFNLVNGAKTNTAYTTRNGFESAYRIIKNGDVTERYLRINGSNVDHNQVIAQLPSTFAKNVHIGFIRTPLAHNGSSIIIETTGEVKVYIENNDSWENSESKYIYGEVSWVD